jgi:choline-sulfatase
VYGAYLGLQRSVTHNGKKLILYPNVPVARLYDIKNDPHEMDDLAKDGKNLALQKQLFAKFLELQKDTGDTLDLKGKFPKLL